MKSIEFSDDELSLIVEALRRMQLVSYACVVDNSKPSAAEVFFKIGFLLSKFK